MRTNETIDSGNGKNRAEHDTSSSLWRSKGAQSFTIGNHLHPAINNVPFHLFPFALSPSIPPMVNTDLPQAADAAARTSVLHIVAATATAHLAALVRAPDELGRLAGADAFKLGACLSCVFCARRSLD